MIRRLFIFSFFCCVHLGAQNQSFQNVSPWIEDELKMRPYLNYVFQSFDEIESFHRDQCYQERAHFLSLGLGSSLFQWSGNLEIVGAKTKRQDYNIDQLNALLTKHIYSDVIGDPFALAAGVKVIQAFKNSLYDVSSFHHGQFEVECYFSMGKECAKPRYWFNRSWFLGAIGQADRGYPWFRGNFVLEKQWWPKHRLAFLAQLLVGTGGKEIDLCNFVGYGSIAHRSIDIGVFYHYLMDSDMELVIGYGYRPYAQNFPRNAQILSITLQNYLSPFDFFLSRWLLSSLGKK